MGLYGVVMNPSVSSTLMVYVILLTAAAADTTHSQRYIHTTIISKHFTKLKSTAEFTFFESKHRHLMFIEILIFLLVNYLLHEKQRHCPCPSCNDSIKHTFTI